MNRVDYSVRIFNKEKLENKSSYYVLGVDVGGTNTNIAIAGIKDSKPSLLFSLDFKTQELESIISPINETLTYADEKYDITVGLACLGVAGPVITRDSVELTNVKFNINRDELIKKTTLETISIINDFEALGYGLNLLDAKNKMDMFEVRDRKNQVHPPFSTKALLGAGTGLGKSILIYDKNLEIYVPIPSEGGHGDFPPQNDFEMQLTESIKKSRIMSQPLTYEELLSGRGIENIYLFLKNSKQFETTDYTDEIDEVTEKVSLISKFKKIDETCKETFRLFTKFYARCAKNFVLDTMATGGLYIAGGIASKNKEIFKSEEFFDEFKNAYRRSEVLKEIPIYIVINYDISLSGACLAAMYQSDR
jgi:glucokinase